MLVASESALWEVWTAEKGFQILKVFGRWKTNTGDRQLRHICSSDTASSAKPQMVVIADNVPTAPSY